MVGSCLTLYFAPSPRGGGIGGYQSTFWDRLLPVRSQLLLEHGDLIADGVCLVLGGVSGQFLWESHPFPAWVIQCLGRVC